MVTINLARRHKLPKYVSKAAKKGLKLYQAGFGGDGLKAQTITEAEEAAAGKGWTHDKIKRAAAWFARHESSLVEGSFDKDKPRPSGVAWLLWGSDPADGDRGREWIEGTAQKFEDANEELMRKDKKYSKGSESLGYENERVAVQVAEQPEAGVMRHTVSPGIDVLIGEDDTVYSVIADASQHSAEEFEKWLKDNDYKAQSEKGDGVEREDGGKVYRLDDGSDKAEYSKPVTTGEDLTFFALTDDSDAKDLHVLKAGPLYDLDSGELALSLSEDRLKEIADTSQAILTSGHAIPLSFEHGIEAGYRGVPSADRRPYGQITEIYYDEKRKAIYAKKRWTALGRDLVEASMVDDEVSALRVSPRVRLTPAYHPDTGELLGEAGYIDVVSLTTLPRQAKMENVALSRADGEQNENESKTDNDGGACCDGVEVQGHKGCKMAGQDKAKAEQVVKTLLSRGTEEAARMLKACDLAEDATGEELSRKVATMKEELEKAQIELGRFKAVEAERVQAQLEAEANELLDSCELVGAERDFYKASLLSDSQEAREFARKAIEEKGAPDQMVKINEAIEAAKERGALVADFGLNSELEELARDNADTVVALFAAMPANQVVRVGEPSGIDAAGIEAPVVTIDAQKAERELSRIARKLKQEGKAETLVGAWSLARTERADLVAAMNGEK